MSIRVCIVEDDREIRQLISELIVDSGHFEFVGGFDTAEDIIRAFNALQPDVVIIDIQLPGRSGIDCIRELKLKHPQTQFLVLTIFEDNDRVFDALLAGATGYLLKNSDMNNIVESILSIHKGESPMSGVIARKLVNNLNNRRQSSAYADMLTERERQIVDLLARGFRYKDIAEKVFISVETVRTHIRNIYEKLQVNSRTEAVNVIYPVKDIKSS